MESALAALDQPTLILIAIVGWSVARAAIALVSKGISNSRDSQRDAIARISSKLSELEKQYDRELSQLDKKVDTHIATCEFRYKITDGAPK